MKPTGKLSKRQLEAINHFANILFSHQLKRYIDLDIRFVKMDCMHGTVIVEDYNDKGLPRSFTIEVNRSDDPEEKIKTIAHEMVHVKQYAKGELSEEMDIWRGSKVNADSIDYFEQPWEIEAESVGLNMYESFIRLLCD
jgi:hypothetical protein